MTALFIILGILALFVLLLLCPITAKLSYEEEFSAAISYLFFRIRIPAPEKPEKPKKSSKKNQKTKQPSEKKKETASKETLKKYQELLKKRGLSGLLSLLSEVTDALKKAGRKFRHLRVRLFSFQIAVVGGDAADTAILYGKTCAVVYPAVAAILHVCRYRTYHVEVQPDFTGEKTRIDAQIVLRISALYVVSAALGLALDALKIFLKLKQEDAKPASHKTKDSSQEGGVLK